MTATQAPTPGPLSGKYRVKEQKCGCVIISPKGAVVGNFYKEQDARAMARSLNAPTAPAEASGSERDERDQAASAFIATSFGFSGPNGQDTPLQAAAREVGWMLSEVVDRIDWNKRGQAANALGRLATSIDGLVWPWEGDDPRHDQIRDAWRSYADNSADEDGQIDLTEVETCVAIGCMKAMQLLSPALRPQPSGETRPTDEEIRSAIKATEYKYFGDYEFTDDQHNAVDILVRAAQALLSARPLALGGQKGDSETLRVLLDNLVIAQPLSKDLRQKATDEARSYLYELRHAAPVAETAGEAVAKVVRKGFSTGSISWTKFGQDADLPDETLLYAHPSPTLAALKSTAAQEGGSK